MAGAPMRRATREELAQSALDPDWWPDLLARLGDGGTLEQVCAEHVWSYGALWQWINAKDAPGRREEYDVALQGKAERVHDQCIPIADRAVDRFGVPDYRMQAAERRESAAVWNAPRYGERAGVGGGGGITVVIDKSCGGAVRIGMKDAGGNCAAVLLGGTEPRFSGAENEKEL